MPIETPIPTWRRVLAYLTVGTMAINWNVEKLLHFKDKHYLSPLLPLLLILLPLTIYDAVTRSRRVDPKSFSFPPLPSLIWAALALISCLWIAKFPGGETGKAWLRGAQGALIFGLLAVWVFQNIARDPAEYRKLALIVGISAGACLLLALRQYVGPMGIPFDPSHKDQDLGGATNVRLGGWYDFRGTLGALTAMIGPAAVAYAILDRDSAVRSVSFCVAGLSLLVTLFAGGLLGATAGIIAVIGALAAVRSWRAALVALIFLLFILTVMLPRLPRDNPHAIAEGVALYVNDPNDVNAMKVPSARLRRYQAVTDLLFAHSDPNEPNSAPFWKKGVGSGQYQSKVNSFYQAPYDKPGSTTDEEAAFGIFVDEPTTFGLLETVVVELGVPGLIVVLLLFACWIAAAAGAFSKLYSNTTRDEATLALAALGAGVGALVLSVFGNPVAHGPGGVFAFFFAVALCAQRWSTVTKPEPASA